MKAPAIEPSGLSRPAAWEHLVRFVFGGLVTVAAGLLGKAFGPAIGGIMLAFPAILPASLTLVKQHDGRGQAVDDARGACIGAIALAGFGGTVALLSSLPAAIALVVGTLVWAAVAISGWCAVFGAG